MPLPADSSFGALLCQFRQRKGLTQRELALRVERHVNSISLWERELELPETHGVLLALARELQLTEDEKRLLLEARYGTAAVLPREQLPFPRNPYFTGRANLLESLHQQLQGGKQGALTQAISGLGGIGKTQTALEYVYRYRECYADVFWLLAETRETLMAGVSTLAGVLQLPEEQEQPKLLAAVKRWLQSHRNWLLILDNLEELDLVRDLLPPSHQGAVILTPRREVTEPMAQALILESLPEEEGMLLLLRRAKRLPLKKRLEEASQADREQARAITHLLGGLPLALDQAGAYMLETGCGLPHFFTLAQARQATLLRRRGTLAADHPASVTTTVLLAFAQVQRQHKAAAALLRWCAYLAPDDIPEELLTQGAPSLAPPLRALATDAVLLDEAIGALRQYSLLRRDPERQTLSLHRLVQVVLREELDEAQQRQWAERVVRMVSQMFPPVESGRWRECEHLLPHALVCAGYIETWNFTFPEASALLNQTGHYLYERAAYTQALPLLQRGLAIREQALGLDDPAVADSMHNLGRFYLGTGKYAEALPLLQRALAIREQVLGPDHPAVALSLHFLAQLSFRTQGQYSEALPLFQRALTIREQALGSNHLDVAESLRNLAGLSWRQGKYAEALPLFRRALDIYEQQLGANHPHVAHCLNGLALIYRDLGRYDEALPLAQRALAIYEHQLGRDHPDLAESLHNLAGIYRAQGQYDEALPLYQRALAIEEQAFGLDHPYVARGLNNLAMIRRDQGHYAEALPLAQRALAIYEQQLGPNHPHKAVILNNLATLYHRQGHYGEAQALYERALALVEQAQGPDHPNVAVSLSGLAQLYCDQGLFSEALPLAQRALKIREQA